jgi:hypothetical protein
VSVTGVTQWLGSWRSHPVTVAWDWAALRGVVVLLNPKEIRTNIRLVDGNGTELAKGLATIHIVEWIESLRWREVAFTAR